LEPLGLTLNCLPSQELTDVNVLQSRIDVHCSTIAHFHCFLGGLSMATVYVNGLLVMEVDVKAFAVMNSA
jgi:hypothetical protein